MERLKFFSHESPVPGKKTTGSGHARRHDGQRARISSCGVSSGKSADEGWFHSPGHHQNQMGNFSRIGVGRSGTYFTQMFGD